MPNESASSLPDNTAQGYVQHMLTQLELARRVATETLEDYLISIYMSPHIWSKLGPFSNSVTLPFCIFCFLFIFLAGFGGYPFIVWDLSLMIITIQVRLSFPAINLLDVLPCLIGSYML